MKVDTRSDWSFTTEEAALADIESLKADFKIKLLECKRAIKVSLESAKALDKARGKADKKRSSRSLTKLSRAEHECDSALNEALTERRRAKGILDKIAEIYDETAIHFMLAGKKGRSKKYTKMCDKYIRCKEESLEKAYAAISRLMTDEVPTEADRETSRAAAPESTPRPTSPSATTPPPFYFVPAYTDGGTAPSVKIEDIKAAVREVLEEQLTPFVATIEEKLAEMLSKSCESAEEVVEDSAVEFAKETAETVTESVATAAEEPAEPGADAVAMSEEILSKTKGLGELLDSVVTELDSMGEKIGAVLEAQRTVNDMQRTLAREMQGMQVKQRIVNEEQTALVESEELILQQQKLIGEKQAELAEVQSAAVQAVEAIMEAQVSLDETVKSSIQVQKGIIQSNSKNLDIQRELVEKQAEIAELQRAAVSAQRKLARRVKPQDPKTPPTDGGESDA